MYMYINEQLKGRLGIIFVKLCSIPTKNWSVSGHVLGPLLDEPKIYRFVKFISVCLPLLSNFLFPQELLALLLLVIYNYARMNTELTGADLELFEYQLRETEEKLQELYRRRLSKLERKTALSPQ